MNARLEATRTGVADLLLRVEDLSVQFGSLRALDNLTLSVRPGEVVGIAGANGAGKTTLFNVISGHVRPASGGVWFAGHEITNWSSHAIFQDGLARTFQMATVVDTQSVYANVMCGAQFARDRSIRTAFTFARDSDEAVWDALAMFGIDRIASLPAGQVSLYDRKLVMMASAMARRPSLLLLDEPIAGLGRRQSEPLLAHIGRIAAEGTTIVVIEHVMRALRAVCGRLVILHAGSLLFDGAPDDAHADEEVQRLYLGTTMPAAIEEGGESR